MREVFTSTVPFCLKLKFLPRLLFIGENRPIVSNEWHFSTWMGDEGQYGAGSAGEWQEGAGGGGDAQPLTLLESASQHAAVTTATVTCRPTPGARPTTERTN